MEVGEDDFALEGDQPNECQPKHAATVREMLHTKAVGREKEKKDARVPLTGFKVVTTGTFTWAGTDTRGGFSVIRRDPTLCDLFENLCPSEVIQVLIKEAENNGVKAPERLCVKDVRQYQAVRIWITSKKRGKLWKKWRLPPEVFGTKPMGRDRYQRLQHMWLSPSAVSMLNEASQSVVVLPEVLTMDEKLKGYTGTSPYIRYVPNKDPCNGHWITETTMKGPITGLPFLINATPVQQEQGPTMVEFYQSSFDWIAEADRKNIVVISDAYYMDDASRRWLRAHGFKYLVAINPKRFAEVWKPLQLKVKKKKHIGVAYCATTGEAAVHFWTEQGKKAYILTNAFTYSKGRSKINGHVFSDTYCHLFNTADRLNSYICKKGYPSRRTGWHYSFDNFHFTTLLWNVYVLYHEIYELDKEIEWKDFCKTLATQLWHKYS
jgi:hypothetical protein